MTDPIKLQILKGLVDGLKTIVPANGYASDLSDFDPGDGVVTSRVYRGRAFFGEGDPIPMLSVLEAANEDDLQNDFVADRPVTEYWWPIIIQGWVQDDKENPTDPVYALMADVRKFLSKQMKRDGQGNRKVFGFTSDYITSLRFSGGRVRPANDLSAYAGFHLLLELCIVDNAEKPYG